MSDDGACTPRAHRSPIRSHSKVTHLVEVVVMVAIAVSCVVFAPSGVDAVSPDVEAAWPAPTAVLSSVAPDTDQSAGEPDSAREPDSGGLLNVGHLFRFVGAIVGVGALAALLWVLHTDKEDLRVVLGVARMLGLVISTGAALEWASYQQLSGAGLGALVRSGRGWAVTLAMLGGILITFGLTERRSLTPSGSTFKWSPGRSSALGLIGAVAVLASFGFDGHGANVGSDGLVQDVIMIIADIVHVASAALWGGGVCVLALVGLLHVRRGRRAGLIGSSLRFSAIAPWPLLALTASGIAMAVVISGADPQSVSSPWGRTLVVKVILVAIAVAVGLYNRLALMPRLRVGDVDDLIANQLRVVLVAEAVFILMAAVVAVGLVQLVP